MCETSERRSCFLLLLASCHPLHGAGSKLVSSQSDFKEIKFVLKFLFED